MNLYRLGNIIRFPLALLVGVAIGFLANSIVPNGAFFVGGAAIGTTAVLWLFHFADARSGAHPDELRGENDRHR